MNANSIQILIGKYNIFYLINIFFIHDTHILHEHKEVKI